MLGIGLVLVVSLLPQSWVEPLPEHARKAVAITVDIRELVVDLVADTGSWAGGLVAVVADSSADQLLGLIDQVPVQPPAWWPESAAVPEPPALDSLPRVAGSFSTAKRWLYERVYADHRETFYCGCRYDAEAQVELGSCGLDALAGSRRARRVEAEHVFPAAQFGNFRQCWREPERFAECRTSSGRQLSGRACCERVDPVFEAAHNDLYNLYPAVGQINGERSDFNWGMVAGGEGYGTCEIRIDAEHRRVEPPARVRGDIARTMFYMRDTYGLRLSRQDEQLYAAWNNADPPDAWERERSRRIARIQGRENPYITGYRRL
ncbi:deoxyribonuclease I [Marichromatium bheemlicum]|uniref:Deoxyribonuclease I n=1 Tax=Marichromatium bheemlicum TaxID=365339 RepID=A0ABX1I5I5_9GAMM|nr:deoxyribonuclease I [Marichromatium bheemlicum]